MIRSGNGKSYSILVPRAANLLASATDRELWQEPILQSAIRGLPVNCAAARFRERGVERKWLADIFHEALNFWLAAFRCRPSSVEGKAVRSS